jgi:PAS domain S-box-containing protein
MIQADDLQVLLSCVANHTSEALLVTDLDGHIIWCNQGFEKLTGHRLDDCKGRPHLDLQACDHSTPSALDTIRRNGTQSLPYVVDLVLRRADQTTYWARINARPLEDREGLLRWYLLCQKDISRTRERQSKLALQQSIGSQLSTNNQLDSLVPGLLSSLTYYLGYQVAIAWEVQQRPWVGDVELRHRHHHLASGATAPDFLAACKSTSCRKGQDRLGKTWADPAVRTSSLNQADASDPISRAAAKDGLRTSVLVPVRSSRRVSYIFEFCSFDTVTPRPAVLDLLDTMAQSIALVIDRLQDEDRIHQLMTEFDCLFKLSSDGFVMFNKEGVRSYANPAFLEMTGLSPGQLDGVTEAQLDDILARLCPPALRPAAIASCVDVNEPDRIDLCLPRPAVLMRTVREMIATTGERIGRAVYLRDVTKETEVDRMKSEFLSTAAHELRTPMVSVHGFSELLLKRDFTEERRKDIYDTIHRQSKLLINMVNELLDLARIESRAGKDFHIAATSLQPIILSTLDGMQGLGDIRQVQLNLPHDLPAALIDPEKFARALMNVLSNAYKYSPQGGAIRMEILRRPEAAGKGSLGVSIKDHGIGMTPEQLARVFERFYRADPSCNIPGTGLGMCLVQEIMALMGGEVEVKSTHGQGTEVTLWLRTANVLEAALEST